ncbi:hypothetical protein PSAC2689_120123 [Paraburkholderia sacchari]
MEWRASDTEHRNNVKIRRWHIESVEPTFTCRNWPRKSIFKSRGSKGDSILECSMKLALGVVALLVFGAVCGGLLALYIALPPSSVPCGDECGGRALAFSARGVFGGVLLAIAVALVFIAKRRRSHGKVRV